MEVPGQNPLSAVGAMRVLALAVLWGSNFLLIAVALRSFSPGVIAFVRLALAAVVLVPIAIRGGQRLPPRSLWLHLAVAAAVANVAPYFLFAWAEQRISSSAAGFLNSSTPILTLALAAAVLRDRSVIGRQILGVLLGFAGVVLIIEPWQTGLAGERAGQAAVLAASACYAISYVYMSRYLTNRNVPALGLAAGQMVFASLLGLPLAGYDLAANSAVTTWPVVSLVVLGFLGTGIAYVINYQIIEADGPTTASTVLYLLPIVAGILGATVLDETITPLFVAGTAVILTGVYLCRTTADTSSDASRRGRSAPAPS